MDRVRKVLVPEDVYRVLLTGKNDLNDLFIRRFQCTAEVVGPSLAGGSAGAGGSAAVGGSDGVKLYEKRLLGGPLVSVWKDDLTQQDTDVVVNAANEQLGHWAGLAGALVKAGGDQIVQESNDIISKRGNLAVGDIAVTSAGRLPSKKIVHAVGPRWSPGIAQMCVDQLREAIRKVLDYVSVQRDLHSVAIPAVSSGIFGFPLDLCADIIVTTVKIFCTTTGRADLKEIRLVNNDDKTVQAMKSACEKILGSSDRPSGATSNSATSSSFSAPSSTQPKVWDQEASSQLPLTINGLNLHLKTGCIENEKTEIIVNSVSSDLTLSRGVISQAIYSKAGAKLQEEIRKKGPGSGHMIPTRGYNLSCGYVYHVILPLDSQYMAEKILPEVTKECLMRARQHRSPSISFPALGTGAIGLYKGIVADIMTQTVLDFARQFPCMMDVYFVIHPSDKETLKAFQHKFRTCENLSNKTVEPTERWRAPESPAEVMCVSISGERSEEEAEAEAWLRGVLSYDPLIIHNNLLLLFGSEEYEALASGSSSVDTAGVEEDLINGRVTLRISGPKPDRVMVAVQAERLLLDVQDKLAESLQEELLEAAVVWFYESQSESHKYSAKAARELEEAHASKTNITLKAPPGHVIDIVNRTARQGGRKYDIRRRSLLSLQKVQISLKPEIEPVKESSPEFKEQSREFQKAGLVLLKMETVQNKLLAGVFQSKKEAAEKRQKMLGTEQMYQLVPRQFWKDICAGGFHRLYVTPHEQKYRDGVYFKKTLPNIMQRFQASKLKDGLFYILQAEVVTGATAIYTHTQPVLSCKGSDALQVYDNLNDGGRSPEHWSIYDRFQANPQYVFTCRSKA
ncbi:protein mono-ADP-ribosyltransferase PARP9 [Dendropsophus ebraccatus]|uniref:protein mono-ADP-ribosyltransferase PARP9 n=1 Tax=Dendropsophus ebraccatus TaxID=150705 RepID=UPI00383117F7